MYTCYHLNSTCFLTRLFSVSFRNPYIYIQTNYCITITHVFLPGQIQSPLGTFALAQAFPNAMVFLLLSLHDITGGSKPLTPSRVQPYLSELVHAPHSSVKV